MRYSCDVNFYVGPAYSAEHELKMLNSGA
jgi:hypothetical protein